MNLQNERLRADDYGGRGRKGSRHPVTNQTAFKQLMVKLREKNVTISIIISNIENTRLSQPSDT